MPVFIKKMRAYIFVLCLWSVHYLGADAYKGAVVDSSQNDVANIVPHIYAAGEMNVDVLVLSSGITGSEDKYDETVKDLSNAAKQAGLYLVANLNENTRCQNKHEVIRRNLVFDRHGAVVAVSRKPVSTRANCTTPTSGMAVFTTDFGVTFGVMMEEDLVLQSNLNGLKNFVVIGAWDSKIPFLNAALFTPAWAYTAEVNVLSSSGIIAGRSGAKSGSGTLEVAELNNNAYSETSNPPVVNPASIQDFAGEDLSQYVLRPMDLDASTKGYKESVCHNSFCCQFHVKTSFKGSKREQLEYGLVAFDGIREYGGNHHIGTQSCAVFACGGKGSCTFGSISNDTNIVFEKITITANFTAQNSVQYPVILSNELLSADRFDFVTKLDINAKQVTIALSGSDNLLTFGIFGRDFENDFDSSFENKHGGRGGNGIYDYIFTEDVAEFFDYVWIRLRILIFIVSIYVLEMM